MGVDMTITFLSPPAAVSVRDQYRHHLRLIKTHTREKLIKVAGRTLLVELTLSVSDFRRPPAQIKEFPATLRNDTSTISRVDASAVVAEFANPNRHGGAGELPSTQRKRAAHDQKEGRKC